MLGGILLACALGAAAPPPPGEVILDQTLAGGARVLVQPRPGCGTFALQLVSLGGSLDDPEGRPGLTAVLTRMLLSGTRTRTAAQQAFEVERTGSTIVRSAGPVGAGLRASGPAEGFRAVLEVAADAYRAPRLDPGDVQREAGLERQALRSSLDDPSSALERALRPQVFGSHPLGRVADPETFLAGLTPDEVRGAHASRFVGRRTLLVVVGDLAPDAVLDAARAALDGLPPGAPWTPPPPPDPLREDHRAVVHRRTTEATLFAGLPTPGLTEQDWPVMDVLAYVLGGWQERLSQEIRETRGWAYWLYADDRRYPGAGLFGIVTAVPARKLDDAEAIVRAELERIAAQPPTDEEVERARRILGTQATRDWQRSDARAAHIALRATRGLPPFTLRQRLEALDGVTPVQVQALARRLFTRSRLAVVTVR
ncbi:MAG: M16 family metallopeptidase [Candidatus Polarisedimenticolia bacterium]